MVSGIMRIQLVCLLLVLVTAAELSPNRNIQRQYKKFQKQHINENMTKDQCDPVMQARGINKMTCKKINTFILASISKVKSVCATDGEPFGNMTKSLEHFDIVVCKLKKKRGSKAKCQYQGQALNRKIIIKCEKGFPVHYDKDIGHCKN